jgi:hypothetical protein
MKKIIGRLFSAFLTLVLAFSYINDFGYGAAFVATIFWILIAVIIVISFPLFCAFSLYDDGELSEEKCKVLFNNKKRPNFYVVIYNYIITVAQVFLLIIIGYPVLSVFYLLANVASRAMMNGIIRRAEDWRRKTANQ